MATFDMRLPLAGEAALEAPRPVDLPDGMPVPVAVDKRRRLRRLDEEGA